VLDPFELATGQAFLREDIPPLFGLTFSQGLWNVGHVVLHDQKAHVLLITLNKPAPFTYHGRANYVTHEGSAPMSVILALH
jgi:hypothetical protein